MTLSHHAQTARRGCRRQFYRISISARMEPSGHFPTVPMAPTPSPTRHENRSQPSKTSPSTVSMESDNRRGSLENTDLRRFLRLHGMQEVIGSSPRSGLVQIPCVSGNSTDDERALTSKVFRRALRTTFSSEVAVIVPHARSSAAGRARRAPGPRGPAGPVMKMEARAL
jgi:hypothetical protein